MFIEHIAIHHFGSICFWEEMLSPELNLVDSRFTAEISAAIAFLLCSRHPSTLPKNWIQDNTQLSARIHLEDAVFHICARPVLGQLRPVAVTPNGSDATEHYQYALSHCQEQNDTEVFDGQNSTMPLSLCRYRCREEDHDRPLRTGRLTDTKTFRRYLHQYIRDYPSETINSWKKYQTTISTQGEFGVFLPSSAFKLHLSETEQKLFHYLCFLNVAEFWAGFESLRDLHHEKKPLLILNFIEFLDESVDISSFVTRTRKLGRQMIILTGPLDDRVKRKWLGNPNRVAPSLPFPSE